MAETFLINDEDLADYVEEIQLLRGLIGLPPQRGGDYELPHREGSLPGSWWSGPRVVSLGGLLYGRNGAALVPSDARARYFDQARALASLVYNGGQPSIYKRVIPRVSGGDLTVQAEGRYLSGLETIEQAAFHAGRFAFDLQLLDAFWHDTTYTPLSTMTTGSYTPTIGGDVPTRRIIITTQGTSGYVTVTNSTTGHWVRIPGSTSAPTVIDIEAMTAIRSSVSYAGLVTHNTDFDEWFALAPGSNSIVITGAGGDLNIDYWGAWA